MNQLQQEEFNILIELDKILKANDIKYFLSSGTLLGAVRHQGFIPWDDDIDIMLDRENFNKIDAILADPNNLPKGYHYQSRSTTKYFNASFSKLRNDSLPIREKLPKTQHGNSGPWVDLFVFDNIPDDMHLRRKQYDKVTQLNTIIKFFTTIQATSGKGGLANKFKNIVRIINEKCYKLYFFLPYFYRKRDYYMTQYNDIDTEYCAEQCYLFYDNFEHQYSTRIKKEYLNSAETLPFETQEFPVPLNTDEILTILYGDYMTLPDEADRKVHKLGEI